MIHFDTEQSSELFDPVANMPKTDRAVMRRPSLGPVVYKYFGTDTEFVTTIGVANLHNRPWHGFTFGHLQQHGTIAARNH